MISNPVRPQSQIKLVSNFSSGRDCGDCECCETSAGEPVASRDSSDHPLSNEIQPVDPVDGPDVVVDYDSEDDRPLVPPPPVAPSDPAAQRPPRARALPQPVNPTREERALHRLTHIPYQTWCSHCVKCRGRNLPHRRLAALPADGVLPVVAMDLGFLKRLEADKNIPFIVARDTKTKITFAHLLEGKSTTAEAYSAYVCTSLLNDLRFLDYKKVILKSDQERSMKALQERIRQMRTASNEQTLVENSPVGESQSNGFVEEAIKDVEEMVGTLLISLEEKIDARLPQESPIIAWCIEYAATLLNYFNEGKDGKTPLERHRGLKHDRPVAEFGECVLYLPLDRTSHPVHCPEPRYEDGIWLGMDVRTTEVLIGTPSGIVRARSVRRRPEEERFSAQELLKISGTPWNPTPGIDARQLSAAALLPPEVITDEGLADDPPPPPVEPGLTGRRTQLKKSDFEAHGYTPGCPGCSKLEYDGIARTGHNEICRKRMEDLLSQTNEGKSRVDHGYQRVATAAMRDYEREQRRKTATATAPAEPDPVPDTAPAVPGPDVVVDDAPARDRAGSTATEDRSSKRARESGGDAIPPWLARAHLQARAQELRAAAGIPTRASASSTPATVATSSSSAAMNTASVPDPRGSKRTGDGDDLARDDLDRQDETHDVPDAGMNSLDKRKPKWPYYSEAPRRHDADVQKVLSA